jgi:protein farnesyltransferase/geranylgeranyltransferase type-1 subunit alpha
MKEELESVFKNEMLFLEQIFNSDSKNYHAWSYKVWIVERYELWNNQEHMVFVDKMLDNDVMNNSVWSFRYFLIMRKNKEAAAAKGNK